MAYKRPNQWRKRLLIVGVLTAGAVLFSVVSGTWWLTTEAGNNWLRLNIEGLVTGAMADGGLSIGGLRTDLRSIALDDVALHDGEGDEVVTVREARIQLRPWALLSGTVRASDVRLIGVSGGLYTTASGRLELLDLFGVEPASPDEEEGDPWGGLPVKLVLDDVLIDIGHFEYGKPEKPLLATSVRLRGTLNAAGTRFDISPVQLTGVLASPGPLVIRALGELAIDAAPSGLVIEAGLTLKGAGFNGRLDGALTDRLDADATFTRLDLGVVEAFAHIGLAGVLTAEVSTRGPLSGLEVDLGLAGVEGTAADLELTGLVDLTDQEIPWNATVQADGWHVEHAFPAASVEIVVTGDLDVRGSGTGWPDGFEMEGNFDGQDIFVAGYDIPNFDSDVRLAGASLYLSDIGIAGFVGDLSGEGVLDLDDGPMSYHLSGPIHPELLGPFGITDLGGVINADLTLNGDIKDLRSLPFQGTVTAGPVNYGPSVHASALSASVSGEVRKGDVDVSVAGVATSLDAYGLLMPSASFPDLVFTMRKAGIGVSGTLHTDLARYGSYGDLTKVEARYEVKRPKVGEMSVAAEVGLGAWEMLGIPGTDGEAVVRMVGSDVVLDADLYDEARTVFHTAGEIGLDTMDFALGELSLAPSWRAEWLADGPVSFRLVDGGVADAKLRLVSPLGILAVDGDVATTGPVEGTITVENFYLDVLAEMFPDKFADASGLANATVHLSGQANEPVVEAAVDLRSLWWLGTARWLDVVGSVDVAGDVLRADLNVGVAGSPLAKITGVVPVQSRLDDVAVLDQPGLALEIQVPAGELRRISLASPLAPELQGSFSADARLRGSPLDPDIDITAVGLTGVGRWRDPGRFEGRIRREDDTLSLWTDVSEGTQRRIALDGTATNTFSQVFARLVQGDETLAVADPSVWLSDLKLVAQVEEMPLKSALAASSSSLSDVAGSVKGNLSLKGPIHELRTRSAMWLTQAQLAGVPVEGGLLLAPVGEENHVEAKFTFEGGGDVAVRGALPFKVDAATSVNTWSSGDMDLTVDGEGVPLAVLRLGSSDLVNPTGLIRVRGGVGGTLAAPLVDLNARVVGGGIGSRYLGVRATDLGLDVDIAHDRVVVQSLTARTQPLRKRGRLSETAGKKPSINVAGWFSLKDWEPATVDFGVELDQAWLLMNDENLLRLGGDISVVGQWPALDVTGDLQVNQGKATIDAAAIADSTGLQPDPALTIHRTHHLASVSDETDLGPSVLEQMTLDVHLDLGRNIEANASLPLLDDLGILGAAVARLDVEGRVGGELDVSLVNGEPNVVGAVDFIGGRVAVLQAEFDMNPGTITFIGDDLTNPLIDLSGTMSVSDGAVNMVITGTAESPEIDFSSEEYADNTQIFTILITGRAPEDISSDNGQGAATALAGLLLNSVLGQVNLGSFSVDPDGSIRFGLPVHRNVYLESTFHPNPAFNENYVTVELDWTLARRLVLQAAYGNWESWVNLFWETRF